MAGDALVQTQFQWLIGIMGTLGTAGVLGAVRLLWTLAKAQAEQAVLIKSQAADLAAIRAMLEHMEARADEHSRRVTRLEVLEHAEASHPN